MITKANPTQAKRLLDTLRDVAPVTYTGLHRIVTGQGGFQSLLRNMQMELGITPVPAADRVTPSARTMLHDATETATAIRGASARRTLPVTEMDLDRERAMLDAIRSLKRIGDVDGAQRLLNELAGMTGPVLSAAEMPTGHGTRTAEGDTLEAIDARAKAARKAKAELHAVGRKRKSPRLSDAEREARSLRMSAFWAAARKATKAANKATRGKRKARKATR